MSSQDPHVGGDLNDMAIHGTKIPNDAGKMRTIPSVPRPDQIEGNETYNPGGIGSADLSSAADNATDIPRRNKDIGATGGVITGIGDQLPAQVESKRLHFSPNNPLAKGHDRYDKHTRQKESDLERFQGEGAQVDPEPGEEGESQDYIRSKKGAQGEGGIL